MGKSFQRRNTLQHHISHFRKLNFKQEKLIFEDKNMFEQQIYFSEKILQRTYISATPRSGQRRQGSPRMLEAPAPNPARSSRDSQDQEPARSSQDKGLARIKSRLAAPKPARSSRDK